MFDQKTHREIFHFRQALIYNPDTDKWEICWVDDLTFNPDVHKEMPEDSDGEVPGDSEE